MVMEIEQFMKRHSFWESSIVMNATNADRMEFTQPFMIG